MKRPHFRSFFVCLNNRPFFISVPDYVGFYARPQKQTMAPSSMQFTPEALQDAILAVHGNEINKREVSAKYNVPIRAVIMLSLN